MLDQEIILHIGFHKTGTSSIQDSLVGYQCDDLRYMDLGAPNHSIMLAHAFRTNIAKNTGYVDSDIYRDRVAKRGKKVRDSLTEQLSNPSSQRSLISAEVLSTCSSRDIIEGLISEVSKYSKSIRTIAYVRPPSDYNQSMWQQKTRHGHTWDRAPEYLAPRRDFVVNNFGETVEFFPYVRELLKCNDVVSDFSYRIGIDHNPDDTVRSNESMSLEAAAILYTHAQVGPKDRRDGWYWRRHEFSKVISGIGSRKIRFSDSLSRKFAPMIDEDEASYKNLFDITPERREDSRATLFNFEELYAIACECETDLVNALIERAKLTPKSECLLDDTLSILKTESDSQNRIVELVEVGLKMVWEERLHNIALKKKCIAERNKALRSRRSA